MADGETAAAASLVPGRGDLQGEYGGRARSSAAWRSKYLLAPHGSLLERDLGCGLRRGDFAVAFGGNSGGFAWAGYNEAQLTDWLIDHRRTQLTPLVMNGRTYPSPFRFGALFQFGTNKQWRNYDLRGYEAALVTEWRR